MTTNIVVWSKDNCPFCDKAKAKLNSLHLTYEVRKIGDGWTREDLLESVPNARSVPQILINGQSIGGYNELLKYCEDTGFNGTGYSVGS
ncbi:MAG: glutaredoxin [Euryarchaeota archaeon]|jgi:glutaredoxin